MERTEPGQTRLPDLPEQSGLPGKSYMIAGLSDDHRAKIEGLQPYRRSNPPHSDLLWCLSSLNNADKHKLLPVTVFSHHAGRFRVTRTRPGTGQVPLPIPGFKAGPVEHGTRLAWYYMPLIEDGMIVQYEPTFSISVDHRGTRSTPTNWCAIS